MRMKSKGYKKGGKMKKYQAGTMVSPDERAVERGNAAMDRISEEGTTNMMEAMEAKDPRSMRPKKRPTDPRSMKPKKRPQPMTKKQQRIAGLRGAASQYDTGTRDTPASEPVRRQGAKDTAKRQLDSLMGGGAKKALGMKAGGMAKKGYKKGGKMPDLTGDGKVTQADVLKGRGVFKKGGMAKKGYAKGGMMKKGYKKGGKVRGAGIAQKGVRPAKMR